MDCNKAVVTFSAIRYMVGSGSYGVGCVCDWVRDNAEEFNEGQLETAIRIISEELDRHRKFGEVRYEKEWLELIDFLKNRA